jgi:PhnB protein
MKAINPWINFNGNAEEAFNFYKAVFGGEFSKVIRFKDLASADFPVADNEADKIMYISLPIGKGNVLMRMTFPKLWDEQTSRRTGQK